MKTTYFPKIFFPTIKLIFAIAILMMLVFIVLKIFVNPETNLKTEIYVSAFFLIMFFGYFSFHLLYFFCFYFKYIIIDNNTLSIFELKKLKVNNVKFDEVIGYSKSEVYFGRYSWKSKSIIIYLKSGKVSEFVNSYVSNLDLLEIELKNKKVKYLGFEGYNTGWFYRQYKFIRK